MKRRRPNTPDRPTGAPAAKRGRRPGASPPRAGGRRFSLPPLDRGYLLILVLAALLRLWGIGDRLPDASLGINIIDDTAIEETDRTTMMRAWGMWRGGLSGPDLNPHTGGWPALSFYATLAIQAGYKAWYGLVHPGVATREFAEFVQRDAAALFLLARILNAIIGVLSVALTWRLAVPLAGRTAAILACLFLAANPLHVLTSQHVSDPNLLALVFVALAAAALARVAEGGGTRDSAWAGLWIGLAAGCKYVPLVLLLPLALAHWRGARWRGFALAAGVALAAMFAASPFTFLDWQTTLDAFTVQRRSLFSEWVGQSAFPIALPTYLISSLPKSLGWPTYLLAIAGTALLWRRGPAGRVVALVPIVVVLANGMLRAAQERYLLLAFPVLMLAAAMAALALLGLLKSRLPVLRPPRAAAGATAALAAVAIAWPMPELWNVRSALRLPDSRHEARRWINANIEPGRRMAVELYGPVFGERERNMAIWPFFATQAPLVSTAYHPEFLDGFEYLVASGEISRRFEADSANYPREVAYYRWLRAHADTLWRSDPKRFAGPPIAVLALPRGISTRAERDSLFRALESPTARTYRVALWCHDVSAVFSRDGQDDRAEEWALRGLQVDAANMNPRLYAEVALARLNLGNFTGAEEAARTGAAAAPQSYALHLYRGMALERLGRMEEALKEVRQALAASGDLRLRFNLGRILGAMGRYEEAVAEWSQVPPGVPERAPARRDMAVVLLNRLGRREEGLAALREAATLATDPGDAALLRDEVKRLEGSARTGR